MKTTSTTDEEIPWDATPFMPPKPEWTLETLGQAAAGCFGCDLYRTGTQPAAHRTPRS